eukprot:CAMPEP_0172541058 /NCGR_PEP_ID=MMETSP1067-20121228/11943_1 /TAXON_ID=265564 ORGANISM="Thalassiosira punctigera, Strain Tpunct2005C2" /NCGR_SAMPLE_ID=MMETSP1067 /ASSEMBLY_ACC=CAM_ASM_000444 /LENGTH=168 /DNA_ID=CAMNT_0013327029 /DNA_START=45 /DNA_END=551 /DNA_ORIENTATION=+
MATTHHKQRIFDLLNDNGIEYKYLQHEETPTSEDSARARGEDLSTGGKALVLKFREAGAKDDAKSGFAVFVLSASRKLHAKSIKKEFKTKNVRFATREELSELTDGLVPGSVPPFGRPVVDLDLFVDVSVAENEKVAFNCGSLTDSVVMSAREYLQVASPKKVFAFSK